MMDWLVDFENRFGINPELQNLKENKFHGKIEINFCSGDIMNYNLTIHRKYTEVGEETTNPNTRR